MIRKNLRKRLRAPNTRNRIQKKKEVQRQHKLDKILEKTQSPKIGGENGLLFYTKTSQWQTMNLQVAWRKDGSIRKRVS